MKTSENIKENTKYLSEMKVGESAVIVQCCDLGRNIEKRLCDIGFTSGETVKCTNASMLGDPLAYLIRGSVIALRKADGKCVTVTAVPDEDAEALTEISAAESKIRGGVRSDAR